MCFTFWFSSWNHYKKKPLSNLWNEGENTYYVCLRDHGQGFDVLFSSYFHLYIYHIART